VMSFLRRIFGVRVGISPSRAIEIAREDCVRRGLRFDEPVGCTEVLRHYILVSPAGQKGDVVFVRVSVTDGSVISVRHILR